MPRCKNCGNSVSQQYAKVMWDKEDEVPACPECEDMKMDNGKPYEYRG